MRIETNFKGHLNEKPPNLKSVFYNRQILMQRVLSALQYRGSIGSVRDS